MEFTNNELESLSMLLDSATAQGVESMRVIISLSEKIKKEIDERNSNSKSDTETTRKK